MWRCRPGRSNIPNRVRSWTAKGRRTELIRRAWPSRRTQRGSALQDVLAECMSIAHSGTTSSRTCGAPSASVQGRVEHEARHRIVMAHGGNLVLHVASLGGRTPLSGTGDVSGSTVFCLLERIDMCDTNSDRKLTSRQDNNQVEKTFNTLDVSSRKVHASLPRKA